MNITESINMAMRSLSANKLRALLTMLGIIIGTGAVIALLSVGQGAQLAIVEQVQSFGSNLLFLSSGSGGFGPPGSRTEGRPLTRQDADAIAEPDALRFVGGSAPVVTRNVRITAGNESANVPLWATTPEYEALRNAQPDYGRFFTDAEESQQARVIILGYQTAVDLYGAPQLALDETIRVNRVPFTIIGVLREAGGQGFGGGGSADQQVLVPLSTAQARLFVDRPTSASGQIVDLIYISAVDESSIDLAIDEVAWLMRARHDLDYGAEDDFTLSSQKDILGVFDQITSVLTIFLGAIAAISLLVGGIGIMNIMLVSVTERTREIGIRKAVGARRRDILAQFLVESILLSIAGGIIGILFGWGVASVVNQLDAFTTFVSSQAVMLAVGFSLLVGLFFGSYPANRAANLNPIEALRYE